MIPVGNGKLPKLLVIGARGFLGNFVAGQALGAYDVYRGDRTQDDADTDVVIDIADRTSVNRAFAIVRPDAVILLAAISDIDRCQRDPDLALAVNLHGAENVANACGRVDAKLLFTSTGAVFDGRKHGYTEEDAVSPVSMYGETKVMAEEVIQALLPPAIIARVSLVLGRTSRPGTNSLLNKMMCRWQAGEIVYASDVESRNPIDAVTLSQWMLELLADDRNRGIYHAGATDSMTRYEIAQAVASDLDVPPELVQPELRSPTGRAPRGIDHFLLTTKISQVCTTPVPTCRQVIKRSLHEVAQSSLRTGV